MKGWTKRRVALILVLALMASQMSGCVLPGGTAESSKESNSNAAVVQEVQASDEEEPEDEDATGWLEEELENIRKSLLDGDYAAVVDLLLEMQDDLANNSQYNALLYIAYMGNGDADKAASLLENADLDMESFIKDFLENADVLKGNEDMASIESGLMNHFLGLAASNPEAYDAIASFGASIQNNNPSDPTVYAARYLAALAAGDEAGAKAILEEAKANGISEASLKSTALDYIEEYDLTNVTVKETEKGKTTTTTYNEGGSMVKTEEIVDNQDGTQTKRIKNSDGSVIAEALYDKATGKLISKVYYVIDRESSVESGATANSKVAVITETRTEAKQVYEYENGKIKSITYYNADGSKNYTIALTANGETSSVYEYTSTGEQVQWSQEKLATLHFELNADGDLVSKTIPIVDAEGKVIGKETVTYDFTNPIGLENTITDYDSQGTVIERWDCDYTFADDAVASDVKGIYTSVKWESYNGDKLQYTSHTGYEHGVADEGTLEEYDADGKVIYTGVANYNEHTFKESGYDAYLGGNYNKEAVVDDSNTYLLTQTVYTKDGKLYAKYFGYYEGSTLTGELDVFYDESGRVIKEKTYENGIVEPGKENKIVEYIYDETDPSRVAFEIIYTDTDGDNLADNVPSKIVSNTVEMFSGTKVTCTTTYVGNSWDNDGQLILGKKNEEIQECEYLVGENTWRVSYKFANTDADGNLDLNSESEASLSVYDKNGNPIQSSHYTHTDADGKLDMVNESKVFAYQYDAANNTVKIVEVDYNVSGTPTKQIGIVETYEGNNLVSKKYFDITLDDQGQATGSTLSKTEEYTKNVDKYGDEGYIITEKDKDGNVVKESYYTSEGYLYQAAISNGEGQMLMMLMLEPEGETAEGETAEGATTEGATAEGATTEGETTEGATAEGETAEGATTEGVTTEGEPTEGETTEGATAGGATTEGETTEGETTEGATTEDQPAQDDAVEEECPDLPEIDRDEVTQPPVETPELPAPSENQPAQDNGAAESCPDLPEIDRDAVTQPSVETPAAPEAPAASAPAAPEAPAASAPAADVPAAPAEEAPAHVEDIADISGEFEE